MTTQEQDPPYADLSSAPMPTARTLRRRRGLATQALRFAATNLSIMRMVRKGHGGDH